MSLEPRISGVESDRSTNWATTTALSNLSKSFERQIFLPNIHFNFFPHFKSANSDQTNGGKFKNMFD